MFHPERSPWERLIWLYYKSKMIVKEVIITQDGAELIISNVRQITSITQSGATLMLS